jgi:hypothetical protein
MPKLIISVDGVFVKELKLSKERSTIGRRPSNDIVIDHLATSGKHASLHLANGHAVLEDLGSTNGTYVNGKVIRKHALAQGDVIEIGKYKIKYLEEKDGSSAPAPLTANAPAAAVADDEASTTPMSTPSTPQGVRLRILSGANAGHEMALTKVVTTIGKPGQTVASIVHKPHGYEIAHLEGDPVAAVNGEPVSGEPMPLRDRDQIELGGVRLEFFER